MESAGAGLWPGLDVALCAHGRCGLADLARGRMENTACATGVISFPMAAQCAVDATLFQAPQLRSGIRGHHFTLAGAGSDTLFVLARAAGRRCFAGALSGLGDFCCGIELYHLAA